MNAFQYDHFAIAGFNSENGVAPEDIPREPIELDYFNAGRRRAGLPDWQEHDTRQLDGAATDVDLHPANWR